MRLWREILLACWCVLAVTPAIAAAPSLPQPVVSSLAIFRANNYAASQEVVIAGARFTYYPTGCVDDGIHCVHDGAGHSYLQRTTAAISPAGGSALGGVYAHPPVTHQFVTGVNTDGTVPGAQPSYNDISGVMPSTACPLPNVSSRGCVKSSTAPTHQFQTGTDTSGNEIYSQPAVADVTGAIGTTTPSIIDLTVGSVTGPVNCTDTHLRESLHHDGTTVTLSNVPLTGCSLVLHPDNFLGVPFRINFNGIPLKLYGAGGHPILQFSFAYTKENGTCEIHYTGVQWESYWCDTNILINSLPSGMPIGPNGQAELTHDSIAGGSWVKPFKGEGLMEVLLYTQRVLPSGLFFSDAGLTNNALNHIYLDGSEVPTITAIADNGAGKIRLTLSVSRTSANDQGDITTWGFTCFPTANGVFRYAGVDGTHVDLPDVSSTGLSGSCAGSGRTLRIYASTAGHAPDLYGVETESGGTGFSGAWIGDISAGGSHSVLGTYSAYGAQQSPKSASNNVSQLQNTTIFYPCEGWVNALSTTEANVLQYWPVPANWLSLHVTASVAPGSGQSFTITRRLNGADTAQACVISDPATSCNDDELLNGTGDIVSGAADQSCSVKVVSSTTAASSRIYTSGVVSTP